MNTEAQPENLKEPLPPMKEKRFWEEEQEIVDAIISAQSIEDLKAICDKYPLDKLAREANSAFTTAFYKITNREKGGKKSD